MIRSPEHGWCVVEMEEFIGNPSYIRDTPMELVECFLHYFKAGCACVMCDEEGSEFTIVLSDGDVYVITNGANCEHTLFSMKNPALCYACELVRDLDGRCMEWVDNFYIHEENRTEYADRLQEKVNTLKSVVNANIKLFDRCRECREKKEEEK